MKDRLFAINLYVSPGSYLLSSIETAHQFEIDIVYEGMRLLRKKSIGTTRGMPAVRLMNKMSKQGSLFDIIGKFDVKTLGILIESVLEVTKVNDIERHKYNTAMKWWFMLSLTSMRIAQITCMIKAIKESGHPIWVPNKNLEFKNKYFMGEVFDLATFKPVVYKQTYS